MRLSLQGVLDAVFFSSKCGVARGSNPLHHEQGLSADEEESDNRCRSVGAAVQFAKSNNLLGVLLNVNLLV
jgi:CDK inhibitor PHO81